MALFLILFVPFNYRPLRYSLLLYFPFVLLIAGTWSLSRANPDRCPRRWTYLSAALLFIVNYFCVVHVVIDLLYFAAYPDKAWAIYGYLFFPVLFLTTVMLLPQVEKKLSAAQSVLRTLIVVFAAASLVFQLFIYGNWARKATWSIRDTVNDISQILGENAVLTGPYAPRFSLGRDVGHFIYAFGLEKPDVSIFKRFPITHLAIDAPNLTVARDDYPEIAEANPLTEFLIRGQDVGIFRAPGQPDSYHKTDFEIADRFFQNGNIDSAFYYNQRYREEFPVNIAALKQLFWLFNGTGNADGMKMILIGMYREFDRSGDVQRFCAFRMKELGLTLEDSELVELSQKALQNAKRLNYGIAESIQKEWDKIRP
jgi:hypothetical protein